MCFALVGPALLFVGVRLSEFPFGLQRVVFCLSGGDRGNVLLIELARLIVWFRFVGLAQSFVWLSPFFLV